LQLPNIFSEITLEKHLKTNSKDLIGQESLFDRNETYSNYPKKVIYMLELLKPNFEGVKE
jgi:hypothetical protein